MIRLIKRATRTAISKALQTVEAADAINDNFLQPRPDSIRSLRNTPPLYDLISAINETRFRPDIVILTSRFRSGSTALWNAFRQLDSTTAYYEPFNERRFFDHQLRGSTVDPSHVGVADYSLEYDNTQGLDALYNEDWTRQNLYMDENSWNPQMQRFIEILAESASGIPVIQFNRVDFRLPWLRDRFPNASIVHLWRDPREQWCSTLTDINRYPSSLDSSLVPLNFYLGSWIQDLKHVFPFLNTEKSAHPYRQFYLIWKTSFLFGQRYATHSVNYEKLMNDTACELEKIISRVNMQKSSNTVNIMSSVLVNTGNKKWTQYASSEWFEEHEAVCEAHLENFFGHANNVNSLTNYDSRYSN